MSIIPICIRVNDVDLMVSVSGKGKPLIWSHGLMSSMAAEDLANWFQWDRLGDVATVIRYDARGHGQSGASASPSDYTWARLARDMIGIADHLKLEHFVAGGMSMGCATALYTALEIPERIEGLILGTPPTAWETRADQTAMYEQMAALVEARGTATLATMMVQQSQTMLPPLLQEAMPDLVNQMGARLADYDATTLATVLRGAKLTDFPPREQLRSITVPTLILAWEGDRGHPVATAEALQALLPNAQAHIARSISDLKMWPELIRAFLMRLE